MTRIAIIGATGQLGYDLMRGGASHDMVGLSHEDIETTDRDRTRTILQKIQPDVVINTAAITKTELCETEPERAFSVNALGAGNVARAASELGASAIYISTDYVFDGAKSSYRESDAPNPLNVYGASKFSGELFTRIANPKHYIIRTGWLFGKNISHKGYNFVTLMRERGRGDAEVKVVNDQTGSPTYTLDLASKIYELVRAAPPFGTYHITNQGSATWFAFAKATFELSHMNSELTPISTEESGTKIARPRFSVLESAMLPEHGISLLRSWREALAAYLDEIK